MYVLLQQFLKSIDIIYKNTAYVISFTASTILFTLYADFYISTTL